MTFARGNIPWNKGLKDVQKCSEVTKQKIHNSRIGKPCHHSDEWLQKVIKSNKERQSDPVYRKNFLEGMKKRSDNLEWKKKIGDIGRKVHSDPKSKERY